MNLLNKGLAVIGLSKIAPVNVEEVPKNTKVTSYPNIIQKFRTREDIRKLENAIDLSENLTNYNREDLHRIYARVMDDPKLSSQWETRKLKTLDKEFRVIVGDEEDEDLTKVLEAGWFMDYVSKILDAKMYGFTLVEFGAVDNDKFVAWRDETTQLIHDPVTLVDRDYVKPEKGIVTRQPGDFTGLDITDEEHEDWLIMEGGSTPGMLRKIARYALFKDNVLGNWSEWAEVFGMDIIIGKTEKQAANRTKFATALRDLGSNATGLFDQDDEIEFIGTNRSDAYKVYMELAMYVDEQIANLIFGQNVVSNNTGQVVGNVGENISNLYGDVDAKFIARNVNDKLFPLMVKHGWKLENAVFEWDNTEQMNLTQKSEIDLKVSQMGQTIDPEYIEDTYGTKLIVPEADESDNPEQAKAQAQLKGSVGGVQGIIQMQQSVAQGLTTKEAAIATLVEIYGIDKATATSIIGNPQKQSPVEPKPVPNISNAIKDFYKGVQDL